MNRQLKATITVSLAGIVSAACAPQSDSYLMTSNTPAPKVYSYTAAAAKSANTPVTHSHSGKVHTHILPPSGIIHTHVAPVRTSNTNTVTRTNTTVVRPVYRPSAPVQYRPAPAPAPRYTPAPAPRYAPAPAPRYAPAPTPAPRYAPAPTPAPRYTPAPQPNYNYNYSVAPQPSTDTYTGANFDYSGVGDYNYSPNAAPSTSYSSTLPSTSANTYYSTTPSDDYFNYTKPKAQPANPNYAYEYNAGNTAYSDYSVNNLKNPGVTASTTSYSGGNSYTVQRGDTVFQVMRNTGVYWKDIIRLNKLQGPDYTIKPGQVLALK